MDHIEKTNLEKKKQENIDFSLKKEEPNDLIEEDLLDWEKEMIKTLGLSKKEYLEKMKLAEHACDLEKKAMEFEGYSCDLEKMAMEIKGNAFKKMQT